MPENEDELARQLGELVRQSRGPSFFTGSSLVIGLLAAAMGGTGLYSSQDRFTSQEARDLKTDVRQALESNRALLQSHLGNHPDKELDRRLRNVELAIQRLETQMEARHRASGGK